MKKNNRTNFLFYLVACLFFLNSHMVMAENNENLQNNSDIELNHKKYIEALVNLKSIEHFFIGEPIYLSKDENLKNNLRNKLKRIIECIKSYYAIDPNNPEVVFFLGKSYSFAHDLDIEGAWSNSVDFLNKFIALEPNNTTARLIQAKNFMDAQQFESAIKQYDEVCKVEPYGQSLKFLGLVKLQLKRDNEAIIDFENYVTHNPEDDSAAKMLQALKSGRYKSNY